MLNYQESKMKKNVKKVRRERQINQNTKKKDNNKNISNGME